MSLTIEDIEFLVALGAREESFLYEISADVAQRLPESREVEAIGSVSIKLAELMQVGLIEVGRQTLSCEVKGARMSGTLPEALHDPSEWAWPDSAAPEGAEYWYATLTDIRVPGRGIEAVPPDRAEVLMFARSAK